MTPSGCPAPNQPGAAVIGEAPRSATHQPCNFILSALASFTATLAKPVIALGQEERGPDQTIHDGLVRAKHWVKKS